MIVDAEQIDVDETTQLAPDNTIGILYPDSNDIPEGELFDLNRLQAAIAEYRNTFGDSVANIDLWHDGDGTVFLALWPDHAEKAVVVAHRVRTNRGEQA